MEKQEEFLFADGPSPQLQPPDPRSAFFAEIAETWHIPAGQIVHVDLNGHNFSELQGRLELARAPDLPFDSREPLALHIGGIGFTSRQIIAWTLMEPGDSWSEREP